MRGSVHTRGVITLLLSLLILCMCPVVYADESEETVPPAESHGDYVAFSGTDAVDGGIRLTWPAVDGAVRYYLLCRVDDAWRVIDSTTALQYTDTDVTPGNTYTYALYYIDQDGAEPEVWDTDGTAVKYLPTPTVSLSNTTSGVKVSWNAIPDAEHYRVYRKSGSGSWSTLCNTAETSYTDTSAVSGTGYSYTVRCVSADGANWQSSHAPQSIDYLSAPVLTYADAGSNGITVKWKAVPGAAAYRVFYKTSSGWKSLGNTTSTSYTDTSVSVGTERIYTVRCINKSGSSYTSSFNSAGIIGKYLATPAVSLSNAPSGVKVSWNAIPGADSYRLYRKSGSGSWSTLCVTAKTSYTDTSAVSGTKYSYTVRCVSADGANWQSDHAPQSINYLSAPVLTYADAGSDGITVKWKAVPGAAAYRVFYKTSSGWKTLGNTTATSYTDTSASVGTERVYTVRCINKSGSSYTSSFNSAGIVGKHLDTPTVSYYGGNGTLTLKWSKIPGADSYRVYAHTGSGWKSLAVTADNSYTVSAVSGKNVRYTVRCVSADGANWQSDFCSVTGRYTIGSDGRTLGGCGSFSKTGGLTDAQQQAILRYMNAYLSSIGSFVNDPGGVFYSTSLSNREKTLWNSVIAVRQGALEDLSLSRYRFSIRVSSVSTSSDTVTVKLLESDNQQFRDVPVLSQTFDNNHTFTLKKSGSQWMVSDHSSDCSPFYKFQYDSSTQKDKQFSKSLSNISARQKLWGGVTGADRTCDHPYNREAARDYMLTWSSKRNSDWAAYDDYGGNCMNFTSQVLYAGGIHQTSGWYWKSTWNFSNSWLNVDYFDEYAANATSRQLYCDPKANYYTGNIGDVMLIGLDNASSHATVICDVLRDDEGRTVDYLLCSNTTNLKNFPAAAYHYTNQHLIRIYGWNN